MEYILLDETPKYQPFISQGAPCIILFNIKCACVLTRLDPTRQRDGQKEQKNTILRRLSGCGRWRSGWQPLELVSLSKTGGRRTVLQGPSRTMIKGRQWIKRSTGGTVRTVRVYVHVCAYVGELHTPSHVFTLVVERRLVPSAIPSCHTSNPFHRSVHIPTYIRPP